MRKDIIKQLLENDIQLCKEILENHLAENEMILDGMVVDANTFEDIREATEKELNCFYTIRINEMRLRMLEECEDLELEINDVVRSKDNKVEGIITEIKVNENNETMYAVYGYTILKWFLAGELILIRKGNKIKE